MSPQKPIVSLSCASATLGYTEQLKAIMENGVKERKSIIQLEDEAKLKRYAEKLKQNDKRVIDLAKRREVEKLEKIAKNKARFEKAKKNIDAVNTERDLRKIELTRKWNERDIIKMKRIASMKEMKVKEKQEKLMEQYTTRVKEQNKKIEKTAALLKDQCKMKPRLSVKPKIKVKKIETEDKIEEDPPEECLYIQVSEILYYCVYHCVRRTISFDRS